MVNNNYAISGGAAGAGSGGVLDGYGGNGAVNHIQWQGKVKLTEEKEQGPPNSQWIYQLKYYFTFHFLKY